VFAGGRNKAKLESARAAYEESVALYRQQILVAFREVEDSLAALQFLERELAALEEAAVAAKKSASIAFERYRAGAINFIAVVDSETARLLAELAASGPPRPSGLRWCASSRRWAAAGNRVRPTPAPSQANALPPPAGRTGCRAAKPDSSSA